MTPFLTRRFLIVALVAGFGLAACDDSEPTQRKAFMDFLQTRIIYKPGLHVPMPSAEETRSFGNYAKQYEIILGFNDAMDKKISARMQQVFQSDMIRSVDELVTRRADLGVVAEGMKTLRKTLDEELAKADAAHAAVKQPEELKAVFDKAYERTVTVPTKAFEDIFPVMNDTLLAAQSLADFADKHRAEIKTSGNQIQASDPKLLAELNRLMGALTQKTQAVAEAQRKLQVIIRGS
jgi:hypothetical protein